MMSFSSATWVAGELFNFEFTKLNDVPVYDADMVIYEVKNPFNRLKDGNFIEITIDTSGDRKVLAVPKSAVVREQGETFVFVFDGGETFERRQIALGAEGADFYEIVSGLKEGERIVIEGVYQLRTTQPI